MLKHRIKKSFRQNQTKSDCGIHTHSLSIVFAMIPATFIAISSFASCTGDKSEYNFTNSGDALEAYSEFHTRLQSQDKMSSKELALSMSEWTELSDTVYKYLEKVPAFKAHSYLSSRYFQIHDSVRTEMLRLAVSEPRTLKDVFSIKQCSSIYKKEDLNGEISDCKNFFVSVDSIKIPHTNKKQTLVHYRQFLRDIQNKGISNDQELHDAIRQEDVLFRTFLTHLEEFDSEPLTDITDLTDNMCKSIFRTATEGRLDCRKVMVMMSMRTTRRLILNSRTCIESFRMGHRLTDRQKAAFYYMAVQPYIAIDSFGMAVLTRSQKKELEEMAETIQDLESTGRLKGGDRSLSEMCELILKFYIASI